MVQISIYHDVMGGNELTHEYIGNTRVLGRLHRYGCTV